MYAEQLAIEEVASRICECVATAIETYASVSGEYPGEMPEYFMAATVFQGLGHALTMTLESNSTYLWECNVDAKRRQKGLPSSDERPKPSNAYESAFGQRRADLVVYRGDPLRKSEMDMFCLVEFKRFSFSEDDYKKLVTWLDFLDACPYGIACGFCEADETECLGRLRQGAEKAGDKWITGRVARPPAFSESYQTFARVVANKKFGGA
jgi:hypothetical protein